MKKIILVLFSVFLIAACGGDDPAPVAAAQGTLGGKCYPNNTCNDGLICSEEKNICIKDPSVSGNDSDDAQQNDSDPSDGGDSTEDSDSTDSTSDDDAGENEVGCGNGTKEAGEFCEKGDYLKCSEVDPLYSDSNFATCNETCSGWNTEKCGYASGATPLATFPARTHELTYLYDGMTAYENAENQGDELWKQALFSTSITMEGGTYTIPHSQANAHWIAGYYENGFFMFSQESYFCSDIDNLTGCSLTAPVVQFGAAVSDLKAGAELKVGISDSNKVNFLVVDFMNEKDCVMLVGYGTLKVDSANISAGSAGNFKFTTSEIGIYLPVLTPEGDVSGELETAGYTICK